MSVSANPITRAAPEIEWPTVLVAVAIYGGFGLLTWFHHTLPWWLILPLGGYLVAWHGSLQHEVVHGHPTRWSFVNRALVLPNLWLWLPYLLYERSHRAHHECDNLADPIDDPESYYVSTNRWCEIGWLTQRMYRFRNTLLGRLTVGPPECVWVVLRAEFRALCRGDYSNAGAWGLHFAGSALTLYWVISVCDIDLLSYVALYAYPGLSLTLLRSFLEHQADPDPGKRIVIVEADPVTALLFLNNNLHRLHHDEPGLAWYRLPASFREARAAWLGKAGGYYFPGYLEIAKRYLLRAKEPVEFPL